MEIETGFEALEVWKEARKLRAMVIDFCKNISKEEKFRLVDQIKRASRSITANIAEGYGRFHYADNLRFCRTARGSLHETWDHFTVAFDETYITKDALTLYRTQYEKVLKLLNGYINYLKTQQDKTHF